MDGKTYLGNAMVISLLVVVSAFSVTAHARTIYVDDDGPANFNNIQAAIDDSNDGDKIVVNDGIYTGPGNYEIDFKGKSIIVKSQNGPEFTIVDAQNKVCCFYFHSGEGVDSVLEGFTITGGDRGLRCSHGAPTITNCIISGNRDGIACYYRRPEITNCIISGNARDGIQCSRSSPIVTNCNITNNGGSGILFVYGRAEITDCIITGNNYGGIYCVSSSPRITNCLIASNHNQWHGGGINSHERGDPTIRNCTITGNSSVGSGGGIFFEGGQPTLRNCIVWSNRDSSGINESSQIYYGGCIISIKHSCIQHWSGILGGTGNTGADPCFVDPAHSDPNQRDYHLVADSPCIDAGVDTWPSPLPAKDLDGNFRQIDGDNDGVVVVDMGAYEYGTVDTSLISAKPDLTEFVYRSDGPNPHPQVLYVWNIGTDTLNWQIDEDCPWLQAEPSNGSSTGDMNEVTLTVDADGLPPGRHVCELTVSDLAAGNSPITVSVVVIVYAEGLLHVPGQFLTIQSAIDAAHPGDTVIVADGIYTGEGNRDIFFAKSITVKSENGPENCIIDCRGTPIHKHRGFYLGGDPNTILDGFTIINGYHKNGAAIDVYDFDRPVITNCIIRSNSAEGDGGGIYIPWYGCAKLINCTFIDNTAGRNGGGIASNGSVIAINCKFKRNSAGEHGGGCYDLYSWPTFLFNCTLSGNSANLFGGGVYTHESDTRLTNCTLTANIARHGGGIYFDDDSSLTSKNCIVWSNSDDSGMTESAQIFATDEIYVDYCCVQGWTGQWGGTGNIIDDPCFVEPAYWDPNGTPEDANDDFWVDGDFHLKSQAGRYNPDTQTWIKDNVTSPCIDAGDMGGPIGFEPFPNGGIINIGVYGGTDEASKSFFGEPVCRTILAGDINHDCKINFKDFFFLAYNWLVDYEQFVCPQCPVIED